MTSENIIATLVAYAQKYLRLDSRDAVYARNALMQMLGVDRVGEAEEIPALADGLISELIEDLESRGSEADRAVLGERIMDALMLRPSDFERIFWVRHKLSPARATTWAYDYAVRSGYVKKSAIDKNIKWHAQGGLEITINLSKPEKNNKDLIKQLTTISSDYPKCTICRENEGFERAGFSRRNMRTVSLKLGGEDWFWQYSPYAYFNEHGIAVSCVHSPMKLDMGTVEKLFDFVDLFPHYFIGNNAPLPRVGGSILMHDHFQGGNAVLPMQKAGVRIPLKTKYAGVKAGILDWYNSAIRLEGPRKEVAALAMDIADAWKVYENPALSILPQTDGEAHSTASCIARKKGEGSYILDIILRNNRTDKEYPDGIFHAHPEYHAVKSESIGLIEAMGLFILPARLKRQLSDVRNYLTGEGGLPEEIFVPMAKRLREAHGEVAGEEAERIVKEEVEAVCLGILDNTAVFKRTEEGEAGFAELLRGAGLELE